MRQNFENWKIWKFKFEIRNCESDLGEYQREREMSKRKREEKDYEKELLKALEMNDLTNVKKILWREYRKEPGYLDRSDETSIHCVRIFHSAFILTSLQ